MANKHSNTNPSPSPTKELYYIQPARSKDFPMKKRQNKCLRTDDDNVQKNIKHDQIHDRLKDDINAQTSTMANDTADDHGPVCDPDANESGVTDTTSIVPAAQELLVQQTIDIITPHPHDVLSGRGAGVNHHPGNAHYVNLVKNYKMEYVRSPAPAKKKIIQVIVDKIVGKNPPGRFIRTDPITQLWECISEEKAKHKTGQALREVRSNADIQTDTNHLNDVERLMDRIYTQDMVASPSPQPSSSTPRLPPRQPSSSKSRLPPWNMGVHSYPANTFQRSDPIQYSYRPLHQSTIAQNTSPREAAMMLQHMHERSPPSHDMSSSSVPATSMSPLRSNNVYSFEYIRHPHSIGTTASSPSRHTFAPTSQLSQRTLTSPNAASSPVHYQQQEPAMMAPHQESPPYGPSVKRLYNAGGYNTTRYPYSSQSHEHSTSRPLVYEHMYEHTHGTEHGPVSAANDNEPIDYNYACNQNQYLQEHLQQHQPHQQHQLAVPTQ